MAKSPSKAGVEVVSPTPEHGSLSAAVTHAFRVSHPVARLGARLSEASDKVGMSPEHCILYLARRVGDVRQARERSRWWGGRVYNSLTGTRTDKIGLSGAVLINSLRWLGDPVPEGVARTADLLIDFDVAERLEREMRSKAGNEGLLS